jgi:hypothetical protein
VTSEESRGCCLVKKFHSEGFFFDRFDSCDPFEPEDPSEDEDLVSERVLGDASLFDESPLEASLFEDSVLVESLFPESVELLDEELLSAAADFL